MKLSSSAAQRFLKAPDAGVLAVLVYGPDRGRVQLAIKALTLHYIGETPDSFALDTLTDDDLKADPARLRDALEARSLMGGDRLVHIRVANEVSATPLLEAVKAIEAGTLRPECAVIVEAGELSPRSKVRKAFEAGGKTASLACYAASERDLADLVRQQLTADQVRIDPAALSLVVSLVSQDTALARTEVEKLALYAGPGETVTEDAVVALLGGSGDIRFDDAAAAATRGDLTRVDQLIEAAFSSGGNPVTALIFLRRHLDKLAEARSAYDAGQSALDAVKSLRPPVFFALQKDMAADVSRWPMDQLDEALSAVFACELAVKQAGSPAEALTARLYFSVAAKARRTGARA